MASETKPDFDNDCKHRWAMGLGLYAIVMTGVLIALSALGVQHINKINRNCEAMGPQPNVTVPGEWQRYRVPSRLEPSIDQQDAVDSDEVDIFLNIEANKQMIRNDTGSVTFFDFKKGLVVSYLKDTDACTIVDQIDPDIADAAKTDKMLRHPGKDRIMVTSEYEPTTDVSDRSLFPQEMQWVCAGKEARWIHKISESVPEGTDKRHKRAICRECRSGPEYCCKKWAWWCTRKCRDKICDTYPC